jgi:hypothetical protein
MSQTRSQIPLGVLNFGRGPDTKAFVAATDIGYRGMADVRGVLLLFLVSLATGTIAGSASTLSCFVQVPNYASREISLHAPPWRQSLPES